MSDGTRFVLPFQTVIDSTGVPIPGAQLFFYASGTGFPFDTYSDPGLMVANSNPVVANAAGVFPNIFLANVAYKVVLTDALDDEIWTADPVFGYVVTNIYIPPQQRSITSSGNLPITSADQILNFNAITDLAPSAPLAADRQGLALTFKNLPGSHVQTLSVTIPDEIDGVTQIAIASGTSLTIVPYNDGVNSGWAIE